MTKKKKANDLSINELASKAWQSTPLGMTIKHGITNPLTRGIRDKALNLLGEDREHIKQFARYLTGGTGGKDITTLPKNVKRDIGFSHMMNAYPEKQGGNLESNLLSTYPSRWYKYQTPEGNFEGRTQRTSGSLGHIQLIPNKDGTGFTVTDKWDVDEDKNYKPWRSKKHEDLVEGGWLAARAYDLANFLGTSKDMNYKVPVTNKELMIKGKNEKS